MLPRHNRLPALEIPRVMKQGRRVVGNGVTLIYNNRTAEIPGIGASLIPGIGKSRFAFIVSTKVDKRAIARNRIRRLMSESVRHELPNMTHAIDGVFIGSQQLIGVTQQEIAGYIHTMLHETTRS